jgi:hypothetical protein
MVVLMDSAHNLVERSRSVTDQPFSTPGLILYYLWSAVTAIVLLNVLISLFSSAYSDVSESCSRRSSCTETCTGCRRRRGAVPCLLRPKDDWDDSGARLVCVPSAVQCFGSLPYCTPRVSRVVSVSRLWLSDAILQVLPLFPPQQEALRDTQSLCDGIPLLYPTYCDCHL